MKDFETNPKRIFTTHEVAGMCDGSMATKMTVQFNLFGGTVLKLGTDKHRPLCDEIDKFEISNAIGCFALTELGFGNNAVEMRTTATYIPGNNKPFLNTTFPHVFSIPSLNTTFPHVFSIAFLNTTFPHVFYKPFHSLTPLFLMYFANHYITFQDTDEFEIHTPDPLAQKYWITNSAIHANHCVVFARLITADGQDEGLHGFLGNISYFDPIVYFIP